MAAEKSIVLEQRKRRPDHLQGDRVTNKVRSKTVVRRDPALPAAGACCVEYLCQDASNHLRDDDRRRRKLYNVSVVSRRTTHGRTELRSRAARDCCQRYRGLLIVRPRHI